MKPRILIPLVSSGYDLTDYNSGTNLVSNPEDLSAATWALGSILAFGSGSTVNAINAPDGNQTAELITPNTTNSTHRVIESNGRGLSGGNKYSCFFKPNGYDKVMLREGNSTGAYASFDITLGTVLDTGNAGALTVSDAGIEDAGDGWFRAYATFTGSTTTKLGLNILTPTYTTGGIGAWAPNGSDGVYMWGAKINAV